MSLIYILSEANYIAIAMRRFHVVPLCLIVNNLLLCVILFLLYSAHLYMYNMHRVSQKVTVVHLLIMYSG